MNVWKLEVINVANAIMGHPKSIIELTVLLICSFTASVYVLNLISKMFKFPMTFPKWSFLTVFVSAIVILATLCAINIYVIPRMNNELLCKILPMAAAFIIIAGGTAPVYCFLVKTKYHKAFLSIMLGIIASAGLVLCISTGWTAVRSGKQDLQRMKEKNQKVRKTISSEGNM